MHQRTGIVAIALALGMAHCGSPSPSQAPVDPSNSPAPSVRTPATSETSPGRWVWPEARPKEVALSSETLEQLRRDLPQFSGVDSVLVARDGRLAFEHYVAPAARDVPHQTRSTMKSIAGLLVGIAIDEGLLQLDDPIFALTSDFHRTTTNDARHSRITVRDALTMQSGLDCSEMPGHSPDRETAGDASPDYLAYHSELPMREAPGQAWHYCSSNSFLLGVAVTAALGRRTGTLKRDALYEYAEQKLFQPLAIDDQRVNQSPKGFMNTQGNAFFRSRDLAKFGQLVLDRGRWAGRQLVSESWISAMSSPQATTHWSWHNVPSHPKAPSASTYGYHWFQTEFMHREQVIRSIHSWGNGGQFIFVFPSHGLVAVITGSNFGSKRIALQMQAFEIIYRYVLPSMLLRFDLGRPAQTK